MYKPSDYLAHPFNSTSNNYETEVVARNIIVILKRTGDEWRQLSWEEYAQHREKDGNFSQKERVAFEKLNPILVTSELADKFCPKWREHATRDKARTQ